MFRHNSFRQCNPLDAMRNTTSNSDSPAGCSFVRTAPIPTPSRFRMNFSQTCLGVAVPLFLRQPGFLCEKDLSNTPAEKSASSTSLGSRRPLASAIRSSKITSTITQSSTPQSLSSHVTFAERSRGGWLILGELAIKSAWGGRSWLACRPRWLGDHIHRLSIRSFPPAVPGWHGDRKLLSKVFNHSPPDQRRDNGDREIRTREDIAQGEPYTLPSSISLGKFPHQEI